MWFCFSFVAAKGRTAVTDLEPECYFQWIKAATLLPGMQFEIKSLSLILFCLTEQADDALRSGSLSCSLLRESIKHHEQTEENINSTMPDLQDKSNSSYILFYPPVLAPFRQSTTGNFYIEVVVVQHCSPTNVFGICKP